MAVREYDSPNPKTVLQNVKRVLESQDIDLLQSPAYRILITHCGFIAHYNLEGFRATYRDHLDGFVESFLRGSEVRFVDGLTGQPLLDHWERYLANPQSYLYDTSYRGVMLADLVRDLITLFKLHQAGIAWASQAKRRARRVANLEREAEALGYTVAPKEKEA